MTSSSEAKLFPADPIPYAEACSFLARVHRLDQLGLGKVHPVVVSETWKETDTVTVPRGRFSGSAKEW